MTDSGDTDGEAGDVGPVSAHRAFELLAHPHRRQALSVLRERGCRMTLDEVARAVMLRVHEVTLGDDTGERFDRIRVGLYHNHLPKLSEANVVACDRDRGTVALAAETGQILRLLDDVAFAEKSLSD